VVRGVKQRTPFFRTPLPPCRGTPPKGENLVSGVAGQFSPIGGEGHVVAWGVFSHHLKYTRPPPKGGGNSLSGSVSKIRIKKTWAALEAARAAACPPSPLRWGAGRAILPGCACRHVFSILCAVYSGARNP
jgi:hypothetical protein